MERDENWKNVTRMGEQRMQDTQTIRDPLCGRSRRQVIALAAGAMLLPFASRQARATSFDPIYQNVEQIFVGIRLTGDPGVTKLVSKGGIEASVIAFMRTELASVRPEILIQLSDPKLLTVENKYSRLYVAIDVSLRPFFVDRSGAKSESQELLGAVTIELSHWLRGERDAELKRGMWSFSSVPFFLTSSELQNVEPFVEAIQIQLNKAIITPYRYLPSDY